MSFSPDGKWIVSGSFNKKVKVWDAQTGQETLTLYAHSGPVNSVSFSPDGKQIVSGSQDHTINVWDFETVRVSQPIPEAAGPPLAVAPFDATKARQHQQSWAGSPWRADRVHELDRHETAIDSCGRVHDGQPGDGIGSATTKPNTGSALPSRFTWA